MKKYFLLVIITIVTSFSLFAQSDPVKVQLDHIFQYINKTQIPTGYLDEYGAQFVDKKPYNGILSDSNIIRELTIFKLIYNDLSTAKINSAALSLPTIDALNSQLEALPASVSTPLIIHLSHYDSLREDGIQQNLFTYSNNQIFDRAGRTQSPYITKLLFAACPTLPYGKGNTISLTYNPALFYSNWNKQVSSVSINFLDGAGYVLLPAHGTLSKIYTDSSGFKKFAIKLVCTDGSIYYCYSGQYVDVPVTGSFANRYEIIEEIDLANPLFTKELAGQYSKGKVYVRYSKKRLGTPLENSIVKPLIVVEGYDIHDAAPSLQKENYNINKLIEEWDQLQGYDFNGVLDDEAGYDLIFVDYYTMDAIQDNAKMLEAVIDEINLRKVNNGLGVREQNVVMGISMGGLVSRYCLAKMTKNRGSASTDTRLLLTMDSPHQGANIPLGFQHFIYDFGEVSVGSVKFKKVSDQLKQFYELQMKPATAQQLIARVTDANGTIVYNTFLQNGNDYRNTITFSGSDPIPSYSFKAVSQGSACAQWVMQPGTNLVDVVDNKMAALNIILWGLFKGKYRLDLKINALPAYGSSNVICDLKVERNIRFFWGLIGTGWVKTSDAQPRPSPSNLIPWDCVPGGTQSSSGRSGGFSQSGTVGGFSGENFENRTLWGWLLEGLSRPLISVTQSIDIPFNQDIFSFVPITSALDIQNPTLASFYQTHVFPVGGLSGSASSGYMAQNKFTGIINDQSATLYNANHTDFTVRNSQWIFNEMENNSQTYDCEDYCENSMSITGANEICSTAIYKVKGLFPGATVTWSATPSNMVVFDCDTCAQTTITRNGSANGQTTITANISGPCGNTNLTIPITVGVPNNPLSIYGIPDNYNSCKNSIFNVTGSGGFGNSVWTVEGGQIISGQGTSEIYIQLDNTPGNGFYIGLFESNACGLSSVLATKQGNILDCDGGGGTTTRISPNPTNGQLTVAVTDVKTTRNSIKAIIVRNKMGRIFTKMEFPKGVTQHTFNIRNLPNDLYLIEIFDGKVWLEHKVILRN